MAFISRGTEGSHPGRPEVPGQQERLRVRDEAHGDLLIQNGWRISSCLRPCQAVRTALRVSSSIQTAPDSCVTKPPAETCRRFTSVKARRSARTGRNSSIKSKARPGRPGAVAVQEPDGRVQSDRLQCGPDVVRQESVEERQEAVHPVARRAAGPLAEEEGRLVLQDQVIEDLEVLARRVPLDPSQGIQIRPAGQGPARDAPGNGRPGRRDRRRSTARDRGPRGPGRPGRSISCRR